MAAERADQPRVRRLLPIKHVTFRPGAMGDELLARHENAGTAARLLGQRYLWLMRRYKQTLRLTPAEAQACCVALRGYDLNDTTLDLVWAKLEGEMRGQSLDAVYGLDAERLVTKVREYSPAQTVALVDAVEVFWRRGGDAAALEASGLV